MKKLVCLFLGLAASLTIAQLYPSKLGLLGTAAFRLNEERVQFEMGLGQDQKAGIADILKQHSEQQDAITKQIATAKPDQYASLQVRLNKVEAATASEVLKLLSPSQQDRLLQLAIQEVGPFALRNPEVSKKVGLTAEQRTKLQAIAAKTVATLDELSAKMGAQLEAAPAGKAGDAKRLAIARSFEPRLRKAESQGEAEVLALLTGAQMQSWKKAKGKPFRL